MYINLDGKYTGIQINIDCNLQKMKQNTTHYSVNSSKEYSIKTTKTKNPKIRITVNYTKTTDDISAT